MDFKLDATHDKFIKMTVSGLVLKPELISAVSQLMQHPEYVEKNSYWDFTEASMGLAISDLSEVIGILRLYRPPKKDFANKSAFLISGEMNSAMANVFITMARMLPFKIKVFNDKGKAESFLCL